MASETKRGTAEKVALFRRYFTGLRNVYGTYDPISGRARQVKMAVTDKVILSHLKGRKPYGVYLLVKDRICAIAVDFDKDDQIPPMEFVARARHYSIAAYVERSKSKGYHVWIFFEEKRVLAAKARSVVRHVLNEIDQQDAEIFPKQDSLNHHVSFGNFINAPLFGPLVPQGRTVFLDPEILEPYPDQWDFLDTIKRVKERTLDEIIEINELALSRDDHNATPTAGRDRRYFSFGLPPCTQRMLTQGVRSYQRVSCFRLAAHLKRLGLPFDIAVASLKVWALKNRPAAARRVITEEEIIAQTTSAYKK